ncbi:Nmad5 family putative nucleotide modification protein [Acinetobacter baumannii]
MRDPLKRKITQDTISTMAYALTNHKYHPILEEINERGSAIADKIYEHFYQAESDQMGALPEGWLPLSRSMMFQLVDQAGNPAKVLVHEYRYDYNKRDYFVFSDMVANMRIQLSEAKPMLHKDSGKWCVLSRDIPEVDQYLDYLEEYARARLAEKEFEEQMRGIIEAAGTFHKLYASWPECRELLQQYEPEPVKKPMPVTLVDTDHLNKELGLPTKKAA